MTIRTAVLFTALLLFCIQIHAGENPSTADASSPAVLKAVVVIADRQSNSVLDIPAAISVTTDHDLKNSGISGFDEVARHVPNVSFNTDFNTLYIRGVGSPELNVIAEQSAVYVLDGAYVPRLDYLKPGLMDVKRIEFLKGPQGSLFGRNAPAGVINVIYGEPTNEWTSLAALTIGSSHLRKAEAFVSGPLADDLTFRIVGNTLQEDGHTLNLANGNHIGDKNIRQARAKLRYQITESLDAEASATYFKYLIGVWGGSEAFKYPDSLKPAIQLLDPTFETQLDRRGSASRPNASDGQGIIVPLRFNLRAWDHQFSSVTSYSRLNDFQGGDVDGSAANLAELLANLKSYALSEDLKVISPYGRLKYSGGLFLYKSHIDVDMDYRIGINPGTGSVSGVQLLQPLSPFLGQSGLNATTRQVFPSGAADTLNGAMGTDVRSAALYGQFTWDVSDSLALTAGGRFSIDYRQGHAKVADKGPVPIWDVLVLGGYSSDRSAMEKNFSPKLALVWEPIDTISLYASYAKGFRAGSYNAGAYMESAFEYQPERSYTYESGIKTTFLDQRIRFNFGGFWTDYRGYQLAAFSGFSYPMANAERARIHGIESDLSAVLYPGLSATAAAGYNKSRFVKYTKGTCPTIALELPGGIPPPGIGALPPHQVCDHSGQPLLRAPEWTGSLGMHYDTPISSWPVHLQAGVDASYKGFEFMDADLDPVDSQGGYCLFNAHLVLNSDRDLWSLAINGKNLGNKLVKTFSGDMPLQPGGHWALTNPPRTFSATLRLNF